MSEVIFIMGFNLDSNCYLINGNTLVDTGAGQNKDYLFSELQKHGVNPEDIEMVVNTHCHYDHIGGNYLFPNAKIAIHKFDAEDTLGTQFNAFENPLNLRVDIELNDGDKIGDFVVIHTPGHTKGGICLYDGENLISGDTIFAGGSVGRMDIGGNYDDMKKSVEKLMKLDVKNLYPGHGPIIENDGGLHVKFAYSIF